MFEADTETFILTDDRKCKGTTLKTFPFVLSLLAFAFLGFLTWLEFGKHIYHWNYCFGALTCLNVIA